MNTVKKTLKIGILGGTFDPIHLGHIKPAKQVFSRFNLDELLIIPAHKPPHKESTNATAKHRVNMVKLVCDQEPNFVLDEREIKRTTLSYSIDTIKEIETEYPNCELYFIMGMDSLLNFTNWFEWENILSRCNLIVNTRPGYDLSTLNSEIQQRLNTHKINNSDVKDTLLTAGKIYLNQSDNFNISSTDIRQKLSANNFCGDWVPDSVLKYIALHQLYK